MHCLVHHLHNPHYHQCPILLTKHQCYQSSLLPSILLGGLVCHCLTGRQFGQYFEFCKSTDDNFPTLWQTNHGIFHGHHCLAPSALSVLPSQPPPPGFFRAYIVHHQSLVNLPKSMIPEQLHSFVPLSLICRGINVHTFFNLILLSNSSRQLFNTISDHPQIHTHDLFYPKVPSIPFSR